MIQPSIIKLRAWLSSLSLVSVLASRQQIVRLTGDSGTHCSQQSSVSSQCPLKNKNGIRTEG